MKLISLQLSEETIEKLKKKAKLNGLSMSAQIRVLVIDFIKGDN